MRVVMGEMNGVRLLDLMNASVGKCSRVTAAVAYATRSDPFFEHCQSSGTPLDFYGHRGLRLLVPSSSTFAGLVPRGERAVISMCG